MTGNGATTYDLHKASDGGHASAESAGGAWHREAIMDGHGNWVSGPSCAYLAGGIATSGLVEFAEPGAAWTTVDELISNGSSLGPVWALAASLGASGAVRGGGNAGFNLPAVGSRG